MANTHKGPHKVTQQVGRIYRRVSWWPVLGVAIIFLGGYTYYQTSSLASTVQALSVALTAEQNDKLANGEKPVAPEAKEIVENPQVVTGEPGTNGVNGRDGKDGVDGQDGTDATLPPLEELKGEKGDKGDRGAPGSTPTLPPASELRGEQGVPGIPGANGTNGKDGKDGTNGVDGTDGADGDDGEPPVSWTWEMGTLQYTCTRVEDFNPEQPQYTCAAAPVTSEE